jgi:hypothetical protein
VLTISDRVPATNATPTNISTSAVLTLISYGKNGNGAITVKGSQNVAPAAGTDELINVNVGGAGTQYFKRDYTDTQVATYGAFDYLVRVIEASELISPLTKDGSLTSASGSLNQTISAINDAILGSTIQTHTPGTPAYVLPGVIPAGVPKLDPWGNNIVYAVVVAGGSITATTPTGVAYTLTSGGGAGVPPVTISMQVTRLQGIFGKLGY